jgi:Zn ribbon nucleic-acid-binding protein
MADTSAQPAFDCPACGMAARFREWNREQGTDRFDCLFCGWVYLTGAVVHRNGGRAVYQRVRVVGWTL